LADAYGGEKYDRELLKTVRYEAMPKKRSTGRPRKVKKLSRTFNTLFSGPFFTYEQDISTD